MGTSRLQISPKDNPLLPVVGIEDSLIDYPGHLAFLIATFSCNLHCTYCHVWDWISSRENITFLRISRILDILMAGEGLYTAFVVSGGEPTLYPHPLTRLFRRTRTECPDLKIRILTNGTNCLWLEHLIEKNLVDSIVLSIIHPQNFRSKKVDYTTLLQDIVSFSSWNSAFSDVEIVWRVVKTEEVQEDEFWREDLTNRAKESEIVVEFQKQYK